MNQDRVGAEAAMKCPNCGLLNPDTARRCDCGYDFPSKSMKQSYVPPPTIGESVTRQSGKESRRYCWTYCANPVIPAACMFVALIPFDLYKVVAYLVLWGSDPNFGSEPHVYVFYASLGIMFIGSVIAVVRQMQNGLWMYAFCTVVLSLVAIPCVLIVAVVTYHLATGLAYNIGCIIGMH